MSDINKGTEGQLSEPFRTYAGKYIDMGLSVVPVNEKMPPVKWTRWQSEIPSQEIIDKWLFKYPKQNIGIITGKLSNITVVDCDNPSKPIAELFTTYGETPVVVRTPSGGCHLYYRFNGEKTKRRMVPDIDIRAEGGLAVAPPSYNKETGAVYHFIQGDEWELDRLPTMKPQDDDAKQIYHEGTRNTYLFDAVKKAAVNIKTLDELQEFAEKINQEQLNPPEKQTQVNATVKKVWEYKVNGNLFVKNENQKVTIERSDRVKSLVFEKPAVFALYFDLVSCHGVSGKEFALSPEGYARRIGKTEATVKTYKKELIKCGLLKETYKGGKQGVGDVSLYILLRG